MTETKRFLGIPYDLHRPTRALVRERWWNHDDPRVFVPKVFGWGWDVNLPALGRRITRRGQER